MNVQEMRPPKKFNSLATTTVFAIQPRVNVPCMLTISQVAGNLYAREATDRVRGAEFCLLRPEFQSGNFCGDRARGTGNDDCVTLYFRRAVRRTSWQLQAIAQSPIFASRPAILTHRAPIPRHWQLRERRTPVCLTILLDPGGFLNRLRTGPICGLRRGFPRPPPPSIAVEVQRSWN